MRSRQFRSPLPHLLHCQFLWQRFPSRPPVPGFSGCCQDPTIPHSQKHTQCFMEWTALNSTCALLKSLLPHPHRPTPHNSPHYSQAHTTSTAYSQGTCLRPFLLKSDHFQPQTAVSLLNAKLFFIINIFNRVKLCNWYSSQLSKWWHLADYLDSSIQP